MAGLLVPGGSTTSSAPTTSAGRRDLRARTDPGPDVRADLPAPDLKNLAAALAAEALASGALAFGLAAGGDNSDMAAQAEQTAVNGDVFNATDVDFATAMIPHHAQALTMVDLTRGRALSPAVMRLTEDVQAAQAPEIEQMASWLTDWAKPIPATCAITSMPRITA